MGGLSSVLIALGAWLQQPDLLLLGSPVTRAEWLGALLGLAMVGCNLRLHPMGWVLAILSALLYALVFFESRLYGQVALQGLFIAMAVWGYWSWTQPARSPVPMSAKGRRLALVVWMALSIGIGLVLDQTTDSALPYADAVPTAGSLLATVLLARRHPENWLVWAAVNALSVLLFAHQGLWPTVLLYAVMAALSLWGWRTWQRLESGA